MQCCGARKTVRIAKDTLIETARVVNLMDTSKSNPPHTLRANRNMLYREMHLSAI